MKYQARALNGAWHGVNSKCYWIRPFCWKVTEGSHNTRGHDVTTCLLLVMKCVK